MGIACFPEAEGFHSSKIFALFPRFVSDVWRSQSRWVIATDVFYVDINVCIVRPAKGSIKSSLACLMYDKKPYRQFC